MHGCPPFLSFATKFGSLHTTFAEVRCSSPGLAVWFFKNIAKNWDVKNAQKSALAIFLKKYREDSQCCKKITGGKRGVGRLGSNYDHCAWCLLWRGRLGPKGKEEGKGDFSSSSSFFPLLTDMRRLRDSSSSFFLGKRTKKEGGKRALFVEHTKHFS